MPADVPPGVRTLLRTCLQKDPRKRTVDATTALFVIDNAGALVERIPAMPAILERPPWRRALVPLAAVIVTAAIAAAIAVWLMRAPSPAIVRTTIVTTDAALDLNVVERAVAITPDGSTVVYRGERRIFVRGLDRIEPREVSVAGRPRGLFISPNGQWIGYFESDRGALEKVAITGGPPVTILKTIPAMRGATWGPDDTIVYGETGPATGLVRVSSAGGTTTVLTRPDRSRGDGDHVYPEFLPGGQAILFTITSLSGRVEESKIAVLDLRTGQQKVLIQGGSDALYASSGHLVYSVPGTLRAARFDPDRLEVIGSPMPVLDGVATTAVGVAQIAIAGNGTLVYVRGGASETGNRTLMWVDRMGHAEPVAGAMAMTYQFPRISPDGSRVALDLRQDNNRDIWIFDFARQSTSRLTFDAGNDLYPVWTPDSHRIIFASMQGKVAENIYSVAADGGERVVRISDSKAFQQPQSITPDGQSLVIRQGGEGTGFNLMLMSLKNPALVRPLVATPAEEVAAELSPDGRWLAYQLRDSSAAEVMVRPFANIEAGPYQVSRGGGRMPLWSRDSRELFYVAPDETIMGVRVEGGESFQFSTPVKVLDAGYYIPGGTNSRSFDISPDGRRFLMIKLPTDSLGTADANLEVVQHWFEELKRLVPQ